MVTVDLTGVNFTTVAVVALIAILALVVAGVVRDHAAGIAAAESALDSGAAARALADLVRESNEAASA